MEIILYILIGLTGLLGIAVLISASKYNFKHWGLTLAGVSYLLGAFISYKTMTWYASPWFVKTRALTARV